MQPARDQLTQRVFMGSIVKCIAVYDSPWWRSDPSTNISFAFDPEVSATQSVLECVHD